jgi:glycosyltransferase involved in cell wall biosynthesis
MTSGRRAPAVTVVVATYNSSATLAEALLSVSRQVYEDFEVLVVGDGCTDDSEEVVRRAGDPRFTWIGLPENSGGPAAPRNAALDRARGRAIAHLGHDDLWFPDHLAIAMAALDGGDADLVSTVGVALWPSGPPLRFSLPESATPALTGEGLSPSTWAHRIPLPAGCHRWPTDANLADDVAFLRRLRDTGGREQVVDTITVLKFPSPVWHLYRKGEPPPLARWNEALASDPDLERERLASESVGRRPGRGWRHGLRRLLYAYGVDRWPAAQLHRFYSRRRRGLPITRRR